MVDEREACVIFGSNRFVKAVAERSGLLPQSMVSARTGTACRRCGPASETSSRPRSNSSTVRTDLTARVASRLGHCWNQKLILGCVALYRAPERPRARRRALPRSRPVRRDEWYRQEYQFSSLGRDPLHGQSVRESTATGREFLQPPCFWLAGL